jgi:hypothetical protein
MSPLLHPIDLVLVACVIASAAAFLARRALGRRPAPACHQLATTPARARPDGNIVLGAALQRGLAGARARRQT